MTTQVALQPALKFNGGGHINHTIFWTNLSPNGGGEPQGKAEVPHATLCFVVKGALRHFGEESQTQNLDFYNIIK